MISLPSAAHALRRSGAGLRAAGSTLAFVALAACGGGGSDPVIQPPVVSLSTSPALEADGRVVIAVALDAPAPRGVTLSYSTADLATTLAGKPVVGYARGGAACAADVDYVSARGTLPIEVGGSAATITITTCNDTVFQANKRFSVTVTGGTVPTSAVATIVNDDVGGLNDTGISACVDAAGATVACSASGLAGQDAQTGRDAIAVTSPTGDGAGGFAYAKVGATGQALASSAAAWSCVRDAVTGLLWQVEPSVSTPATYPFSNLQARVDAANNAQLCGVANWRLPAVSELASLVNSGKAVGTAIDVGWFSDMAALSNTSSAMYWSATTYPGDTQTAWVVDFSIGAIGVKNKASGGGNDLSLRLVSGTPAGTSSATPCTAGTATNAASDRFVDNADGTVSDKATQLMWMQCSQGLSGTSCTTGAASSVSWSAALATAATVNANPTGLGKGYADWRVPNRNELGSLVERDCRAPAINAAYFPGTVLASYWSSSPAIALPKTAWQVNFVDGDVAPGDTAGTRNLRLVRAGN